MNPVKKNQFPSPAIPEPPASHPQMIEPVVPDHIRPKGKTPTLPPPPPNEAPSRNSLPDSDLEGTSSAKRAPENEAPVRRTLLI